MVGFFPSSGELWRPWCLVSPWYGAVSVAAARAEIMESYLARVERGRDHPSPGVTYAATRLYLPPHAGDDLVFQVANEVKQVMAGEEAPIEEMVNRIWMQAREHVGVSELSRITVFLSSVLLGGGLPELGEGALTETGYRSLLFRWVAMAFAADPEGTTERIAAPPTQKHVGAWGHYLMDFPVPPPGGNNL